MLTYKPASFYRKSFHSHHPPLKPVRFLLIKLKKIYQHNRNKYSKVPSPVMADVVFLAFAWLIGQTYK